ncbi:glycosyltransferase [Sporolactobacillus nakayamae]|uniref:Glycosyltransferase involved in cell wall bisynthesis n=1 Tax=Sporolactobacillus nakayamae TaxID=269670 RepID=A0A1I2W9T5_9BACL|nr:glycosyltransferase [Sporolactobacillus nakayamae]SFG96271.1 Glycosyltransferase involved in cell wall bisynthesis [Sporolactobacillus nakayamae]
MFNATVWMNPKVNKDNKYNELLSNAIEREGIRVKDFSKNNIWKIKSKDIVHFHWIAGYYQSNNRISMLIRSLKLLLFLNLLRLRGIKIVWTVHNVYPHEYKWKNIEKIIRKMFIQKCNKLFVASVSIKQTVIDEFKVNPSKIEVILHGHYKNAYPIQNVDYRRKYSIPSDKIVFLFVGAIREYKNVSQLLEAFTKLDRPNVHLIIAGKVFDDMRLIAETFPKRNDITYDLRFIPDNELADLINISEYIVLPYKNITTSGTAILSVSLRKKIIVPDTSFMKEYFSSDVSIMYDEDNLEGLFNALKKCSLQKSENAISEKAYISFLQKLDWKVIGKRMKKIYSEI